MNRTMLRYAVAHIDLHPTDDGFVSVHIMGHGIGHFTPKVQFGLALTNHLDQFRCLSHSRMRYTPQAQRKLFGKKACIPSTPLV
jgi:hypothetical protein